MEQYTIVILYLLFFRLAIITAGVVSIILGYKLFVKGVYGESTNENTSFDATVGNMKMSLKNAAPGTFFALFGVIIITVMLLQDPPGMNVTSTEHSPITTPKKDSSQTLSLRDTLIIEKIASDTSILTAEEIKYLVRNEIQPLIASNSAMVRRSESIQLRGEENTEITSLYSKNEEAIMYLRQGEIVFAKEKYKENTDAMALSMNGLAWRYYKEGKYDLGSSISKLAVDLAPDNADFMHTYASLMIKLNNKSEASSYMQKMIKLNPSIKNSGSFKELEEMIAEL